MPESTTASRWAQPVKASAAFTDEQAQRVQALRAAREVLETTGAASVLAKSERKGPDTWDLLEVAEWITTGTRPEDALQGGDRRLHAADFNGAPLCGIGSGLSTSVWDTLLFEGIDSCPTCRTLIRERRAAATAAADAEARPVEGGE